MTDTETRVIAIMREHFGDNLGSSRGQAIEAALSLDTRLDAKLIDDLRLDSLDVVEFTMATEDEFQVEITDDEADTFLSSENGKTVRDWCGLVDGKVGVRAAA